MLSPREAFKAGFLLKCAQDGRTQAETEHLVDQVLYVVKQAGWTDVAAKPYNTALDVAGNTLSDLGNVGVTAALLGPALAGAAAGYGTAKLQDIDDTDVDTIKKRELADEYRRQAQRLRQKMRIHKLMTG